MSSSSGLGNDGGLLNILPCGAFSPRAMGRGITNWTDFWVLDTRIKEWGRGRQHLLRFDKEVSYVDQRYVKRFACLFACSSYCPILMRGVANSFIIRILGFWHNDACKYGCCTLSLRKSSPSSSSEIESTTVKQRIPYADAGQVKVACSLCSLPGLLPVSVNKESMDSHVLTMRSGLYGRHGAGATRKN